MTNASTYLFDYYETRPYLVWEGETILLPIESDDGGYRPRNKYNTGDSAWDKENHERLASGGLEIDEELGEEVEEYYNWLIDSISGLYEDWVDMDKEDFMDGYGHYENADTWDKVFQLWETMDKDMVGLWFDTVIEDYTLYINLRIGDS